MSLDFYRRLSQVFGLMLIGGIFGVISFAALGGIRDLDLWLHLRMGQYILEHGYVPAVDVLSATGQGLSWNNHEWFFQVVIYQVKAAFGMDGLLYMQSGLVVLTCLILLLVVYHRDRQLAIAALMYLVFEVFQTRFTVRPDIFSFLFYALFIYILSAHLCSRWSLAALFIIQCLWVNMHGYFFLGVVFVVIALAAEMIKRKVSLPWEWSREGRLTDEEFGRLKIAGVVVLVATLVNPQGLAGALYPFNIFRQMLGDSRIFLENITELARPITWATLFDRYSQWPLKALIFISFISFILNRRRIDISALMLWLFFLAFGLTALRNMVYLAFACYLVTMVNCSNLSLVACSPFKPIHEKYTIITGIFARILFAIFFMDQGLALSQRAYYDFEKYERKSDFLGIDQRSFPHEAADFLVNNGIQGRFLNDFNSGAYLIGRAFPNVLVYMDGRTELRGPEFFKKYKKIWDEGNETAFDAAVKQYNLTGVFTNTATSPAPENFLEFMAAKNEWKVVYFDYDAIIFLKDVPENAEAIKKFSIDLLTWKPKLMDLKKFGPSLAMPYHFVSRGYSLYSMGYLDQAVAEADAMLAVSPDNSGAYNIKSRVYEKRKDYDRMFSAIRLAVVFSPGDIRLRGRLSYAYLMTGDLEHALKEAEKMIERAPASGRGDMAKAKVFMKKKQFKEGYDILLRAFTKEPRLTREALEAGDIAFEDKEYEQAEKIYRAAVLKNKESSEAFEKLGNVCAALGRKEEALKEWKKSLELKSRNKELEARVQAAEK